MRWGDAPHSWMAPWRVFVELGIFNLERKQGAADGGMGLPSHRARGSVRGVRYRLADRPAYSVLGRTLRWRSSADMAVVRQIVGGSLRQWSRRRQGKPRLRWEESYHRLAGDHWWDEVGSGRPLAQTTASAPNPPPQPGVERPVLRLFLSLRPGA